ncbi:MAG: extracellular solute-binding protein [Chloroflexi bacterium]|nr:extracellular solute-binding protein [Chloroflexota bacterium]
MKTIVPKFMVAVVLILILAVLSLPSPSAAAETVRMYSCLVRSVQDSITTHLEQRLGMTLPTLTFSCGEQWARIQAETRGGKNPQGIQADLIFNIMPDQMAMGKAQGLWMKYPNSPVWKGIDPYYMDPDGQGYNLGTFAWLLMGNKNLLKEKGYELPRRVHDLLDPKWKGQIVLPSPLTSGTAYMINISFLSMFGEEEGWKFLERFDKNVAQYTRSGSAPALMVGRGEYVIAMGSDEGIPELIQKGMPLVYRVLDEGLGVAGNWLAIPKGSKNVPAAQKVIDYVGSEEFQKFFSGFGYLVARPGIPNPLYPTKPKFMAIKWDFYGEEANRTRVLNTWKEKFGLKMQR